jgi:hypothetical protein
MLGKFSRREFARVAGLAGMSSIPKIRIPTPLHLPTKTVHHFLGMAW